MKINFLKEKKSFKKKEYQINPRPYWNGILFFIFFTIAISFYFNLDLFLKINKEVSVSETDIVVKMEENRKIRIEKVLSYFSEKEKKSEGIIISSDNVVDPSI